MRPLPNMLGIGHSSMNNSLKENLQHAVGLLIEETRDTQMKPIEKPEEKPEVKPIAVVLLTCLV